MTVLLHFENIYLFNCVYSCEKSVHASSLHLEQVTSLTCRKGRSRPHGGTSETPTILSSGTPDGRGTWLWHCRGTRTMLAGEAEVAGSKLRFHRLATTQQTHPRQTWTGHRLPSYRRACGHCSCRKGHRGVRAGGGQLQPPRNCHRPMLSPDLQVEVEGGKQSLMLDRSKFL